MNEFANHKFVRTLKAVMHENGLNALQLSKRLGICVDYIDDLLIGYHLPDYETLQTLKNVFGYAVDYYFE